MSVDDWKAAGNAAFAAGDYARAIEWYNRCIAGGGGGGGDAPLTASVQAVLYSNRAAAFLARDAPGDALNALADANAAIRAQPTFAKAYGRKGAALQKLGQLEDALGAYQAGLRQEPSNAVLRDGTTAVLAAMAERKRAEAERQAEEDARVAAAADPVDLFFAELDDTDIVSVRAASEAHASARGTRVRARVRVHVRTWYPTPTP
ncbi:hypothetical protein EON68_02365, partial [archaeon]